MPIKPLEWLDPSPVKVSPLLLETVGGNQLLAELLARRGLTDPQTVRDFLNPDLYQPASPYDLPGMEKAVERVLKAHRTCERVGVWGDFDVDGQTATTLLISAMTELGLEPVYHIPMRADGHGIQMHIFEPWLKQHQLTLVITCDTGIAAHEAVAYAMKNGVDVIITDHHQLPETLPEAYACINPQQLADGHAMRTMAGVGTAYMLIKAVFDHLGKDSGLYLDLVALGSVADVALLHGDTRYHVQLGLRVLRKTIRAGLLAVLKLAQIPAETLTERDIAFGIAPRLNALGRLGYAGTAVELLTTTDQEQALILANQVEALNSQRKVLMKQIYESAQAMINRDPGLLKYHALVLVHPHWPGGVTGIVANQLAEEYRRPVVLLTSPEGEIARGSARSIEGIDITRLISSHSQLLESFGGHTMAAGLSLRPDRIEDFRRALSASVAATQRDDTLETVKVDIIVPLTMLSLEFVRLLGQLSPYGAGFTVPILGIKGLRVARQRSFGRRGEHLRFVVEDADGNQQDVLWWGGAEELLPEVQFDLACVAYESVFRGVSQLQVEYVSIHPIDIADAVAQTGMKIVDYRSINSINEAVNRALEDFPDALVWCDGASRLGLKRNELRAANTLIIASIPPSFKILSETLQNVHPDRVVVCGEAPAFRAHLDVLEQIGGVIRYSLREKQGMINLERAAAALNLTIDLLRLGLEWWQAKGSIMIVRDVNEEILIKSDNIRESDQHHLISMYFKDLLSEIEAFQRFYVRADLSRLISEAIEGKRNGAL